MPAIEEKTKIATMLQDYPQTANVLARYRLGCIGCHGVKHETVKQGAVSHGIDLDAFLHDLNAVL